MANKKKNLKKLGLSYSQFESLSKTDKVQLIKRSYRKLAIISHPDKHGGDGRKMQCLNAAYESLNLLYNASKMKPWKTKKWSVFIFNHRFNHPFSY